LTTLIGLTLIGLTLIGLTLIGLTLIGLTMQLRVQGRGSQAGGTTSKTSLAATIEASHAGAHRLGLTVFCFLIARRERGSMFRLIAMGRSS